MNDRPWFVGCVESEVSFVVFGPLWSYEDAEHEASQDYNPGAECGNRHLISQNLGEGVVPRLAPYYLWDVGRFVLQEKASDWLWERGLTPRQIAERSAS